MTTRDFLRLGMVLGFLVLVGLPASAELRVAAVRIDGAESSEAPGVLRKAPGEARPVAVTLRVGDAVGEGVELTAPARMRIELASRHGNRITLSPGARLSVGAVRDRGEDHALHSGEASFSIRRALDFYHVSYKRFLATVRGTEYRVLAEEGRAVEFAVSSGEVEVERSGKVRVGAGDDQRDADTIREAERIAAGGSKRYALDVDDYLRSFDSYVDAERYYREALARALASGEEQQIQRARYNLGVILATFSRYEEARAEFELGLALVRKRHGEGDHAAAAAFIRQIGVAHAGMGRFEPARAELDRAFAMHRRLARGEEDDFTARMHNSMGLLALQVDSHKAAIEHLSHANRIMAREGGKPDRRLRFIVLNNLGFAHFSSADYAAATRAFDEALALQRELDGDRDSEARLSVLANLARAEYRSSQFAKALAHHEEFHAVAARLYGGRDQQSIVTNLQNTGATLSALSRFAEAAARFEEAAAMARRLFPDGGHPSRLSTLNGLGTAYLQASRFDAAIAAFAEALAVSRKLYGKDHEDTATLLINVGAANIAVGRYDAAVEALTEADALLERLHGGRPSDTRVYVALNLAMAQHRSGGRGVRSHAERALRMLQALHGDKDHIQAAAALSIIGRSQMGDGDFRTARDTLAQAAAMRERLVGRENVEAVETLTSLGSTQMVLGRIKDALEPLEKAAAMAKRLFPDKDHALVAVTAYLLGYAYSSNGQSARAMAMLEQSDAMLRRLLAGKDNDSVALNTSFLGSAYLREGDLAQGVEAALRGARMMRRVDPGGRQPLSLVVHAGAAEALAAAGRYREATDWLETLRRSDSYANPLYAAVVNGTHGGIQVAMGRHEEGIIQLTRSLREVAKMLGSSDNDSMLAFHTERGAAHAELGDLRAAESDFEQAMGIVRRVHGDGDSVQVAALHAAIGSLRAHRGELREARDALARALAMRQRIVPAGWPDIGRLELLIASAGIEAEMGLPTQAAAKLDEARSIVPQLRPGARPRAGALVALALGQLHFARGEPAQAAAEIGQAVEYLRGHYREAPGLQLAGAIAWLASAEAARGDRARALALVEEASAIQRRVLGDRDHALAASILAARARAQADPAEASALWVQAIEKSQRVHGSKPRRSYVEAMNALAGTLQAAGRPEEARRWQERGAATERELLASR